MDRAAVPDRHVLRVARVAHDPALLLAAVACVKKYGLLLFYLLILAALIISILYLVQKERRVCDEACNRGQCVCAETCPLHRGEP